MFLPLKLLFAEFLDLLSHVVQYQLIVTGVSLCIGALFSWRAWRFTIQPWLHPDEPLEVPYWIPFLGHARAFLSNQHALLSYGREYFRDSRQPFALTLGREKLYVLTAYNDIITAYRNNVTLDYGPVIEQLMGRFGVSSESSKKVFNLRQDFIRRSRAYNPHGKTFFGLKSDFYHAQLHPGPKFEATQKEFLRLLGYATDFGKIPASVIVQCAPETKSVSLFRLCQETFIRVGTQVFFGKQFLRLNPRLVHDFIDFDNNNWMVFYGWPRRTLAEDPMRKVLTVIQEYLDLPKAERADAAWLITMMEEAQRHLDIPKQDVAIVLFMLMWV